MAYELAVMEDVMSDVQLELARKYSMQNYVRTLTLEHKNSREEILQLEEATRGQSDNLLWKLLRINRDTASGGSSYCGGENVAMEYGLRNEKKLKKDNIVMGIIVERVEEKLNKKVVAQVLECGLFLSDIGLYSASPDAYFVLDSGELVVLEIKCPYTYRNDTFQSVLQQLDGRRSRVARTALKRVSKQPLILKVEQRNLHYRQMQSQLYVTGAVMAVYMVKFSDMPDIHFVERNEAYIKGLADRERMKLEMYVKENKRNKVMSIERERVNSFRGSGYAREMVERLAREGLYCWCGNVICYFCGQQFEVDNKSIEEVLGEHKVEQCDRTNNVSAVRVHDNRYLNVFDRINNLNTVVTTLSSVERRQLAKKGYYYDGNRLVLYCCGGETTHKPECHKGQQ
uniref:Alk-exo n=1 Tax=Cydia pomonella granulosis virus TaxID=28289 RepID=A0A097P2F1_GVCP|nr:ORF125 alk-exo [Cydia pomonella granulovirus]AIU37051.1 ORF125 alk-exo [Cydia pomonella granulovirus]AIU37193.1 ORF125 alk-exo [Cydia pomonella granulovirus]AIU37332.1 ORF125 alk-exo [Cydia pomonella granulovirus]QDW81185.1 alk-exo [Cydia pomonella granulovirus]